MRFAEVVDRTAAEGLRGRYLEADVVEPLPPGHHYWHDLIGVPVRDEAGRFLGRIVDVYRAGGAEVFSVSGGSSGEVEVPAVRDIVRRLDPGGEGVVVDRDALGLPPPAGESRAEESSTAESPPGEVSWRPGPGQTARRTAARGRPERSSVRSAEGELARGAGER